MTSRDSDKAESVGSINSFDINNLKNSYQVQNI